MPKTKKSATKNPCGKSSTIKANATLVYQDPVITPRKPVELREVVNGTDEDALAEATDVLFDR